MIVARESHRTWRISNKAADVKVKIRLTARIAILTSRFIVGKVCDGMEGAGGDHDGVN